MHFSTIVALFAATASAAPQLLARNSSASAADASGKKSPVDQHLPAKVKANPRGADKNLSQALVLATTQRDRINLLNQPGDTIFDFTAAPAGAESVGKGGKTVSANAGNFPALIGNNAAMTVAFLKPCGLNSPHVHNRATELNIPVKGRLVTSFIVENGVTEREDLLDTFNMAVFPQGAIHAEYNPDCDDAVFVAGFNSADPGVEQVAQAFFGLRTDIVQASLNGVGTFDGRDIESFRGVIPANVVVGVETCLKKCGLQKRDKRSLEEVLAA